MGQVNTCDSCGKKCIKGEFHVIPENHRRDIGIEVLCLGPDGKEGGCMKEYLDLISSNVEKLNKETNEAYVEKFADIAHNGLIDFMKAGAKMMTTKEANEKIKEEK